MLQITDLQDMVEELQDQLAKQQKQVATPTKPPALEVSHAAVSSMPQYGVFVMSTFYPSLSLECTLPSNRHS